MKLIHSRIFSIGIIAVLGALVYGNTFHCSFHFDDLYFVIKAPYIRDISNIQNIWNWWPCRFVTFLTLAFNYHFYHLNVFGYHLFNIAVHLFSAILVWWFVLLTFSTPMMRGKEIVRHADLIALSAGLLFVSHPVQTQAVTFIWQRAASLTALFYLAALCCYIKSRILEEDSSDSIGRWVYYAFSLLAAIMAMFTKEISITLPLMVVLYEFSFFRTNKEFNWKPLIPFLFILLIIPAISLFSKSEKAQSTHSFVTNVSSMQYLLTEFRVILTYIRLLFLPVHQNLDYDYSLSKSIFEFPALSSFVLLAAIFLFAKRLFLEYRLISFSIFWFFLTLIPESSVFPFGDVIFEHRLYLPMVAYCMFLPTVLYYVLGTRSFRLMVIVLIGIIGINSLLTYQRNKVWQSEITLWSDVVLKSPHKSRPYLNLGSAYIEQGDFTDGLVELDKAIELNPKFTLAYYYRGNVYNQIGDNGQALFNYNKANELVPGFVEVYINRGALYARQGNLVQALRDLNKAIELNPGLPEAFNNRAGVYYQLKEYNKAWEDVHAVEMLGGSVNPELMNALKQASGKP